MEAELTVGKSVSIGPLRLPLLYVDIKVSLSNCYLNSYAGLFVASHFKSHTTYLDLTDNDVLLAVF